MTFNYTSIYVNNESNVIKKINYSSELESIYIVFFFISNYLFKIGINKLL